MNLIIYNKDRTKSFSISPSKHCENKQLTVWLDNEEGEGGQFNASDVDNVIFEALEKYFKENF